MDLRPPPGPTRPDPAISERRETRTLWLGGMFAVAFALIAAGCFLIAPAVGLIVSGLLLAVYALLAFAEVT